ncbi:MAG: DnaJ domain-containing protein [Thermoanaerobaculia bacterium]|nr:DnaJ domain-containing protein [Thermoanaerobaculia bacterium]
MKPIEGDLAERSLPELVRELHESRASGTLELTVRGQRRRLHFVGGDIHLPATNPLARRLAALQAAEAGREGAPGRELTALVQRMVEVTADWRLGSFAFRPAAEGELDALVGPLPTLEFARLGAAALARAADPLHRLGGERARWVSVERRGGPLSPTEQWIVEQLRHPSELRALLDRSPVPRADLLRAAADLAAGGSIRPVDGPASEPDADGADLAGETLQRLRLRIATFLQEQPLDEDLESQRSRVGKLLASRGSLDHYELLGLGPFASADDVQRGYEETARLVHPLRAAELGLEESAGALGELFDQVTTAYLTLADGERRREYDRQHGLGLEALSVEPREGARREERREIARDYFERALAYEARDEIHFAIEMLSLATTADPTRSQYFLHLGRLQARNPNWLRRAATSYLRGIELSPREIGPRLELAAILEKLGELPRARVQYHTVLRIDSTQAQALDRLKRLEEQLEDAGRANAGLLGRIFRKS